MLKMTGIELEKISDIDKYLFIEKGTRGGISYIAKRESAKSRAWRACVLAYFACLRACVLTCLACLRAYVLSVIACLRAWHACVLACWSAWRTGVHGVLKSAMQ